MNTLRDLQICAAARPADIVLNQGHAQRALRQTHAALYFNMHKTKGSNQRITAQPAMPHPNRYPDNRQERL
ncbi:hypothetical protein Z948_1892 [Sulfitobacter donghicola DSW-25 = KCTC 12864 = JCM 14565]|uniref:Uncharacterized protein n=1 Tax=Sulfitobacter donghicola DSW-25 = KCTC 12864 = JCM 14565 TaxID=1300350 RepID=A0A073INP4_9RHOB|nr:hypothetical protein DSW25_03005 [Sulfitobacter donghicola DSW-25 = KCTC 12864 = JCM 14565]KIN68165.1 hypothetical protein Z948_1892 [Sulfitobacter donghicola DSW-25 = KCTC 12864 = JCM 14565]